MQSGVKRAKQIDYFSPGLDHEDNYTGFESAAFLEIANTLSF